MLFSDLLYKKASMNKVPLSVTFELSPVCNFSCKMCYVRKTEKQIKDSGKRIRTYKEWLDIAKQIKEEGTLYLLLTGGEPFIYPHFKELYIELHKMGFIISINSNGTMIDETTLEWLKEYAPSRINITLYGGSKETYHRICQNSNGYDKTVKAIKMLKEANIPVVINASMIPENKDDVETIVEFGKSLGLNTRMTTYMFPPIRRDKEETDSRFTPEESARINILKNRCILDSNYYNNYVIDTYNNIDKYSVEDESTWGVDDEYIKCRAGRCSCWINWEGHMSACGMTPFPIITYPFEHSFHECWMTLTNAVRSTTVLAECKGCKKKDICNPCVAMTYAETGDVNKKAPYLCELTDCIIENIKKEYMRIKNDEQETNN